MKLLETFHATREVKEVPLASFTLVKPRERNRAMIKSSDALNEAVRNPKHLFRKTDNQPKKALKHRYERRKVKEYLHLGDWMAEEAG